MRSVPAGWSDPIFSAEEANRLLGLEGHVLIQEPAGGHLLGLAIKGGMADVLTLFVSEHLRRQGIARRLMAQFIEHAKTQGAVGITLEVRADNAAAIGLYQTMGFAEVARRVGYYDDVDALVLSVVFG